MFKPPKPSKPPTPDADLFDLITPLKIWAIDTYMATATKEQKRVEVSDLTIRFIWDDIIVTHEKPEYFDNVLTKLPKSHSLFSTTFQNNTDAEQEYNFRTERCTRSIAEIEISKGVVMANELSLKLSLPCEILEANAGFKHELSLGSASRQCKEEELAWSVDTRITVPAHSSASAEVNNLVFADNINPNHDFFVSRFSYTGFIPTLHSIFSLGLLNTLTIAPAMVQILEEQFSSGFRLLTKMHGRLRVLFQDSTRDNAFLKYVEGDLGNIYEKILSHKLSSPQHSDGTNQSKPHVWTELHKCGQRVLCIETWGKCQFRFGVHQNVEVNQKHH